MAKMTRQERAEKANAERQTATVAEFRIKAKREREKKVYSDRAAFDAQVGEPDKSAQALYELVHEYERMSETLKQRVVRMQERMTEALKRIESRDARASWYSTTLGDLPADIEQAAAKREALAEAIARLAWATGWYVPQIANEQAQKVHALLTGVTVVQSSVDGTWLLRRDDDEYGTKWFAGETSTFVHDESANEITRFETEELAFLAFMALCGERWGG